MKLNRQLVELLSRLRAVNPDRIRSEIESACGTGLSQALFSEVTFKNGRVQQVKLPQVETACRSASPKKFVVHTMGNSSCNTPLGSVRKPRVPVNAPAISNAIQAAVGKRIPALPLRKQLMAWRYRASRQAGHGRP